MKILLVDGQRTVGGGQVMTRNIARILAREHEVAVAIPDGESDMARLVADLRTFGFPQSGYSRGRKSLGDVWRFATDFWAARAALVRAMREWRPDLVYIQNSIPVPFAVAAARAAGVPAVAHLHIRHGDRKSLALLDAFLSWRGVRAIVAPSAYTLGQLSPRLAPKFRVVHNFVERREASPRRLPERAPVVAAMGDVCEAKGQHILFEAAAMARVPLTVRVAGPVVDEAYRARIEAREWPFPYTFEGRVADGARWLAGADLAVFPSASETFCLAMAEAWSHGVPTPVSRGSGMEEIVKKFMPALAGAMLFHREDRAELARKMSTILTDPELYATLSRRSLAASRLLCEATFASGILATVEQAVRKI